MPNGGRAGKIGEASPAKEEDHEGKEKVFSRISRGKIMDEKKC